MVKNQIARAMRAVIYSHRRIRMWKKARVKDEVSIPASRDSQ